jgi:hypothetical protein
MGNVMNITENKLKKFKKYMKLREELINLSSQTTEVYNFKKENELLNKMDDLWYKFDEDDLKELNEMLEKSRKSEKL